jgi:hypothetical protein
MLGADMVVAGSLPADTKLVLLLTFLVLPAGTYRHYMLSTE